MDFDTKPCSVCGSEVELRPASVDEPYTDGAAGPEDGFVGDADSTPDRRVCTNPDCPANSGAGDRPEP